MLAGIATPNFKRTGDTDYEKANDDLLADGQPERGGKRGDGQPFPLADLLSLPSQGQLVPKVRPIKL